MPLTEYLDASYFGLVSSTSTLVGLVDAELKLDTLVMPDGVLEVRTRDF